MRLFAALALVAILATSAFAVDKYVHYSTFSEAAKIAKTLQAEERPCMAPNGLKPVFFVAFQDPGATDLVAFWYEPNSGRIVFAHWNSQDGDLPDEVAFAKVDLEHNDLIPPLTWVPYDPVKMTSPCTYLLPNIT